MPWRSNQLGVWGGRPAKGTSGGSLRGRSTAKGASMSEDMAGLNRRIGDLAQLVGTSMTRSCAVSNRQGSRKHPAPKSSPQGSPSKKKVAGAVGGRGPPRVPQPSKDRPCRICQSPTHWARQCPKRGQGSLQLNGGGLATRSDAQPHSQ